MNFSEDFERVDKSLEYIREEVRKDDSLQEVYEDKIKLLAGLEVPIEPFKPEKSTEVAEEEPEEVEEPTEEPAEVKESE